MGKYLTNEVINNFEASAFPAAEIIKNE